MADRFAICEVCSPRSMKKAWMTGPATLKVPVYVPIATPRRHMSSPSITEKRGTNLSMTKRE